jgi:hypothetical protein
MKHIRLLSLIFVTSFVCSIHAEQVTLDATPQKTLPTKQAEIVPAMIQAENIARYMLMFAFERKDLADYNKEAWGKILEKSLDFGRAMQVVKQSGAEFPYQVFVDYIAAVLDIIKSDETKSLAVLLSFGLLPLQKQTDTKVLQQTVDNKAVQQDTDAQ